MPEGSASARRAAAAYAAQLALSHDRSSVRGMKSQEVASRSGLLALFALGLGDFLRTYRREIITGVSALIAACTFNNINRHPAPACATAVGTLCLSTIIDHVSKNLGFFWPDPEGDL